MAGRGMVGGRGMAVGPRGGAARRGYVGRGPEVERSRGEAMSHVGREVRSSREGEAPSFAQVIGRIVLPIDGVGRVRPRTGGVRGWLSPREPLLASLPPPPLHPSSIPRPLPRAIAGTTPLPSVRRASGTCAHEPEMADQEKLRLKPSAITTVIMGMAWASFGPSADLKPSPQPQPYLAADTGIGVTPFVWAAGLSGVVGSPNLPSTRTDQHRSAIVTLQSIIGAAASSTMPT